MEGGCSCRRVRYRIVGTPLIVHACHCSWCQRETGTAHALNALFEADRVVHLGQEPELMPWVVLPDGARAVPEVYDRESVWSADSLARLRALRDKAKAGG